jgi:pyruvate/2-oxoglutarate dehydrogenase complex dihydrolipoamide dehydrogenase (E3) component
MSQPPAYDAIIIGAGQGGMPLAQALAEADWSVAMVERRYIGGTCINDGCTPTKAMVASAKVAQQARRSGSFGIETGDVRVHLDQVIRRKDEIVHSFRSGNESRLVSNENIDVIMGEASFLHPGQLLVAMAEGRESQIASDVVVINTGSRPRLPDIPGLQDSGALTSTDLLRLKELPQHLLIVGGGYIGVEFAQMYRRFGAKVTLIQRGPQLLAKEDADVAEAVAEILTEDGIQVLFEASPVSVGLDAQGQIRVSVQTGSRIEVLKGSHLLLAVGRVPNTDSLHPEVVGLEVDRRGHLVVDDQLRTNVKGVYAIGDVKGGPAFTHISYDDFRVLRANLLDSAGATIKDRMVPYTVFIDPQLGRIGLTEQEARQKDPQIRVATLPMAHVSRTIATDQTRGFMKAVVDSSSDRILGAAVLAAEGGEIASALQIAMMGGLPFTALRDGTFAHPTLMESFNNLFAEVG